MSITNLLKSVYKGFIASRQYNQQHQQHNQQQNQQHLSAFCKSIRAHKTELGLFIQYADADVLNHWIKQLCESHNMLVKRESDFSATVLFKINEPDLSHCSLFNLLTSWQTSFEHEAFVERKHDTLSERFDLANHWMHSWMSSYLKTFDAQAKPCCATSLQNNQIIYAVGIQQSIKHPLEKWLTQDQLWWQNIAPSALSLALLSHNYLDKQGNLNPNTPLTIQFDQLLSCSISNPQVKLEQVLQAIQDKPSAELPNINKLILNFEIQCLNACTFFKSYKLLYALFEFERLLQNAQSVK